MGILNNRDQEFSLAMVRAYNDWLAEYVSAAPERLFGMCLLPAVGVDEAIAEMQRCMQLPGMIGPTISNYPHGDTTLKPEDDRLWAAIMEAGVPLNIHVGLTDQMPTLHKSKVHGDMRAGDAMHRMQEFMFNGVLDRYPGFKVIFTEVDCGWVPFYKEQTDNRFHRLRTASGFGKRPPSEYFDQHYYYTFVSDAYAIRNRDAVGVENMLWSDDYPHLGGDWPHTQRGLVQSFFGVPKEDRELIWAGNATRLYNLPGLTA